MDFIPAVTLIFAVTFLFCGFSILKGGCSKLIYNDEGIKEEDKEKNRKAFAKGMFVIAFALGFDGILALFGFERAAILVAGILFFGGLIASIVILPKKQ